MLPDQALQTVHEELARPGAVDGIRCSILAVKPVSNATIGLGEADIEEGNWIPFAHLDGEVRLGGGSKLRLQLLGGFFGPDLRR